MKQIYSQVIIVVVLIVIGTGLWILSGSKPVQAPKNNPVACTEEAKICPDGSSVSRTGPNCEFAACPATKGTTSQSNNTTVNNPPSKSNIFVASLDQKIIINDISITPKNVISDSRCPSGVACIQAGEISVKVSLEKRTDRSFVILKENGSVTYQDSVIVLNKVLPTSSQGKDIKDIDYKFYFSVIENAKRGNISGYVTLYPICPVETYPISPSCAPKPFATTINVYKFGSNNIYTNLKSDPNGYFSKDLDPGTYIFQGNDSQKCSKVTVEVKSGVRSEIKLSCDTGIR